MRVRGADGLVANARLFDALQAAFGVRFAAWEDSPSRCDAVILVGDDAIPSAAEASAFGVPTLAILGTRAAEASSTDIHVGRDSAIDRRLHGIVLVEQPPTAALAIARGESVLADGPLGPAWATSRTAWRIDRVSGPLPVLGEHDVLRQGLRVAGSLALLALVQLIRSITPHFWSTPGLRASFVFDDPNLRRPSYGHINYRALVAHADAHRYHVAIAMIPLDARRPSAKAVATFRERPDRLSIVMHGNDHVRRELMQPLEPPEALALGAQALRRIARFERDSGMSVQRIMMPPHGLCSHNVVRALGQLGYEAVCAIHPAPWTEDPPADQLLAGWSPVEFLDGCAILPRFPLVVRPTEIALRAFLNQPLVLYGHHEDVAGGMDDLAAAAARVNAVGDVRWCSISEMAHDSHEVARDGSLLRVRPWARLLRVAVPEDVDEVVVESPPGASTGMSGWTVAGRTGAGPLPFGEPHPVNGSSQLALRLVPHHTVEPRTVRSPRHRTWPAMRRRVTEMRDRLAPMLPPRRSA